MKQHYSIEAQLQEEEWNLDLWTPIGECCPSTLRHAFDLAPAAVGVPIERLRFKAISEEASTAVPLECPECGGKQLARGGVKTCVNCKHEEVMPHVKRMKE